MMKILVQSCPSNEKREVTPLILVHTHHVTGSLNEYYMYSYIYTALLHH